MTEAKALLAIAKAQRALLTLTKRLLRDDQLDGLRAAEEAKEHSELYFKFRDKWRSTGLIDESEAQAADKVAGLL